MDAEVKQRNRRRRRAQRMQAIKAVGREGDSGDEDDNVVRAKPPRPPNRRKKSKEPLAEEDIIDGFSILGFRSYEDLELVLKIASKENIKRLVEIERPKLEPKAHITHHISAHNNHGLTITHDPATSDDSGRASERLTGSSVAPRDADSSRDRLSDASSRCSSGKGYICDSEGEDDKGSDASSVIFASTPASRKHEFPGALPPSLPLSNGTSSSPVPAPTPPNLPVPSPAPAQQPPLQPPAALPVTATTPSSNSTSHKPPPPSTPPMPAAAVAPPPTLPVSMPSVPVTMPQPAAAPIAHHPLALDSTAGVNLAMRTDSPAVATSANAAVAPTSAHYHHPSYQPLYAPYAMHTPYSTPSTATVPTVTSTVATTVPPPAAVPVTTVTAAPQMAVTRESTVVPPVVRPPSPRGHSPNRERESYSSNVSSLSRSSITPQSCAPPSTVATVSSSLPAAAQPPQPTKQQQQQQQQQWSGPPAAVPHPPRPTPPPPPMHSTFAPPMFAAPLPPAVSTASPLPPSIQPPNPNPFSAESLFQTSKYQNQADMLRRELDNRFLASQDRSLGPAPYLRTEMHQHQHHHTHVHQHTTSLLPPPAASSLFPSPLKMSPMEPFSRRSSASGFKDIPKIGSVESPFYRQNIAMPNYPGYTPSLMHPGLTAGPTPFVPPNHLPSFQTKSMPTDPTKPKIMKTGRWNAMHVRVAWEIYHHQQKNGEAKGTAPKTELLRPPTHLFSPSVHSSARPHDLSAFPPPLSAHRPPTFEQPHPSSLFAAPPSHLGKSPFLGGTISPFTRYGAGFAGTTSPFGISPFAAAGAARDLSMSSLHDPWRSLQRTVPTFPPTVNTLPPSLPPPAPWTIKPDPMLEREREAREREERERERLRREREERERREREEKQRRLEQQQQQERERERREKERREMERRELERERERERERLIHQQRLAESAKQMQQPVIRERSPLRNGQADPSEIRIKEEPRTKTEDIFAQDPKYYSLLRHPPSLPLQTTIDRTRIMPPPTLAPGLPSHYPPPHATHWSAGPPTATADPYYHRFDHLRYNPLVESMRAEEERAKLFGAYGPPPHPSQLRTRDPGLMPLRPGPGPGPPPTHKMSMTPPTELLKKEEPR